MTSDAGADPSVALQLSGISKSFGELAALSDVNLSVRAGTVHALLGENGAGKTTLVRIAAGLETADRGEIRFFGRRARGGTVAESATAGVGMVHQHLSLVPHLTTTENFALGRRGLYRQRAMNELMTTTCAQAGLAVPSDVAVADLSIVEQQRLEIVKALARGARVLILDEPTALLAPGEVDDLLRWVRQYRAGGGTVVFVTHKLREVFAVADTVTVLRRGAIVRGGSVVAETTETLADAIFGQVEPAETVTPTPLGATRDVAAPVMLRLSGADVADDRGVVRVRDANLVVRRGDIVGVAAVEGSGHRELLQALAGLRPTRGAAMLPDRIAMIPADRTRDALIGDFSLTENVALRGAGSRRGVLSWRRLEGEARAAITRYGIAARSPSVRARTLSGGNQQRLVLARELADSVDLVIADNPTRGLDARATAFVLDQLQRAAAAGAAVVVHSSDLDEVLSLATRAIVVHQGRLTECPVDRDVVGRAMLGVA